MMRLPVPGRRSRWLVIVYGMMLLGWLSLEDLGIWPVTLFGAGLAALIVFSAIFGKLGGRTIVSASVPVLASLVGGLIGAGSALATAGLMFFKGALHGHLFPDYPVEMMLAMLAKTPAWAVAGGLLGLSLGLVWLALHTDTIRT